MQINKTRDYVAFGVRSTIYVFNICFHFIQLDINNWSETPQIQSRSARLSIAGTPLGEYLDQLDNYQLHKVTRRHMLLSLINHPCCSRESFLHRIISISNNISVFPEFHFSLTHDPPPPDPSICAVKPGLLGGNLH
jgi:hypothetical protein